MSGFNGRFVSQINFSSHRSLPSFCYLFGQVKQKESEIASLQSSSNPRDSEAPSITVEDSHANGGGVDRTVKERKSEVEDSEYEPDGKGRLSAYESDNNTE